MKNVKEETSEGSVIARKAEEAWKSLTLASNFIFCKVMANKELCIKILSEILGEEVTDVEYPEYEKNLQVRYDAKSVRLDVYVKGHDNTIYKFPESGQRAVFKLVFF